MKQIEEPEGKGCLIFSAWMLLTALAVIVMLLLRILMK